MGSKSTLLICEENYQFTKKITEKNKGSKFTLLLCEEDYNFMKKITVCNVFDGHVSFT